MVDMAKVVRAGIKTIVIPETIPGTVRGRVTLKKVCRASAPRSLAAFITLSSMLEREL